MELKSTSIAEGAEAAVHTGSALPSPFWGEPAPAARIHVLVVDKSIVESVGLTAILNGFPDLRVLHPAHDATEALRAIVESQPDIVMVGLGPEPAEGLAFMRELRARRPEVRMIAFSTCTSSALARAAAGAGAAAFVLRDDDPANVAAVLRGVHEGKSPVAATVPDSPRPEPAGKPAATAEEVLTPREIEVLRCVAEGHSSREIGRLLGIRLATVHAHRASIMKKLNIHKAVGLAQYWLRHGSRAA